MPIPTLSRQEITPFSHFELLAKQVVEGFITGLHRSPFHGFSVEFAEHRQYNAGESTRHLDWKLLARTEKLFVKRYEEETNLRCYLVLDTSGSMYFPVDDDRISTARNKITFSAYAAAALTELMRKQRDAFSLTLFSDSIQLHTPAKGSVVHQRFIFHQLEQQIQQAPQQIQRKTEAAAMLHQIAEMIHKRALVFIFSDMLEGNVQQQDKLLDALQHLRHNKHEVVMFHVMDKKLEQAFDFDNRPYRFVDLETGQELKLNPQAYKEKYTELLAQYTQNLKMKCVQYGIDFIEADINAGFHAVLWEYLVKRSKMI